MRGTYDVLKTCSVTIRAMLLNTCSGCHVGKALQCDLSRIREAQLSGGAKI